ncbi:hypothetical protein CR513_12850, partial [Mucuna pruriens]
MSNNNKRCSFLTEKSEAFVIFKQYKNQVEKESDLSIKCLRTNHGGEFTSLEFTNFCNKNGIRRQLTVAYTLQQNGVAERKKRTLMNMVRSMLSRKKISNKSLTLAVKNKCPKEAWSGFKPSVAYFRVACHIPDCKRSKIDDKSNKLVLLGVSEESKAYRLYGPFSQNIIVSRDVVFEENKSLDWDKSHRETTLIDLNWDGNEK